MIVLLDDQQYEALRKYRDSVIPMRKPIDPMTEHLCEMNLIAPQKIEYTVHQECDVTYQKTVWLLTAQGKLALENFECNVREERAQHERNKTQMEKQRFSHILEALAIATVSAIIAGIFLYYWPGIVSFFENLAR